MITRISKWTYADLSQIVAFFKGQTPREARIVFSGGAVVTADIEDVRLITKQLRELGLMEGNSVEDIKSDLRKALQNV